MGFTQRVSNVFPVVVNVTTNASGAAEAYSEICTGELLCCLYVKASSGNFADGVDFDITLETSLEEVWDQDNVNATTKVYPRTPTVDGNAAASLYAGSGEPVETNIVVCAERIKIVVAGGGDTKVGKFIFFLRA